MRKFFIVFLALILIVLVAAYFLAGFTYSDGERVGHLVKISQKGLIFKTYEGELNLGGLNTNNNTVGNYLWRFSVVNKNSSVYDSLVKYQGKEVRLHYKQKLYAFPWQGDTEYFVDNASKVE